MTPTTLTVLATVDPLLRDAVAFGVVTDRPRTVVLRHDIVDGPDGGGIRRVVADAGGVLEDVLVPLAHACLSCSVREDAVPTLERLARDGRWDAVLLALPVSAESLPVTRALGAAAREGGRLRGLRLARVVAALDLATLEHDLLGDDLLAERGIALTEDDERGVGEALAAQVAHADVLLVSGDAAEHPVASDLLDHVRAADGLRVDGVWGVDADVLLSGRHDAAAAERRLDPRAAAPVAGAPTAHGVWTLDLRADRPLHPDRLVAEVSRLGGGRHRSRGHFWVPTRPDSVCGWDGAGRQLSIGEIGTWGRGTPSTRLVFTGVDDVRGDLLAAFEDVLVSAREHARGLHAWLGREDVLAPWLGDRAA
ncbi:GTP-binding protein [Cellulomonas sp. ES6]|uniref:CobW family GTP-binding protein n=1 Tax=Cellulomonas sp. ES6 TaxID=3039384 RepID=UPI0024B74D77|nr:GTP-binding protein [Cellulomonas sp. ES6]WHP18599.1 GTP-binding protein [Cellulomonas sp. ES6]